MKCLHWMYWTDLFKELLFFSVPVKIRSFSLPSIYYVDQTTLILALTYWIRAHLTQIHLLVMHRWHSYLVIYFTARHSPLYLCGPFLLFNVSHSSSVESNTPALHVSLFRFFTSQLQEETLYFYHSIMFSFLLCPQDMPGFWGYPNFWKNSK